MAADPNRVLVMIAGGVVALIVASAVVIALRPAPTFDPATPEGTVQAYLQAVFAGDEAEAAGYIDPQSGCEEADILRSRVGDSARVVLVETETSDETARVEVEVVISAGQGAFDAYEYSQDRTFDLVAAGDRWLLTGEPWPVYFCSGDER